eukprot:1363074-Pyramimonas_sp.AAC.3
MSVHFRPVLAQGPSRAGARWHGARAFSPPLAGPRPATYPRAVRPSCDEWREVPPFLVTLVRGPCDTSHSGRVGS